MWLLGTHRVDGGRAHGPAASQSKLCPLFRITSTHVTLYRYSGTVCCVHRNPLAAVFVVRCQQHLAQCCYVASVSTTVLEPSSLTMATLIFQLNSVQFYWYLSTCWLKSTSGNCKASTRTQIQHKNNTNTQKRNTKNKTKIQNYYYYYYYYYYY